jgi:micrococcal nuclease
VRRPPDGFNYPKDENHGVRRAFAATAAALALAACGNGAEPADLAEVARVIDGDTIELTGGERVRLVQIDAPELQEGECHAAESAVVLTGLLPRGAAIRLEADPRLDDVDRFGRLLRYVHRGDLNVNLELVRRGAASAYFFRGDRGRFARELAAAARRAEKAGRGLWAACPSARFAPRRAVDTGT